MTTRVLIVDDHPVVRDGLRGMLAGPPDIEMVGEATTGLEAIAAVDRLLPDVVLMDLRLPELDGVQATKRIVATHPEVHVVVLSTYDHDDDIAAAIEAGATGYLLKDAPRADLFDAIRAAARGQSVLAPTVAAKLIRQVRDPTPSPLTPRELDVLGLVARGDTNRTIAQHLFVSEATIKTHLINIFRKLEVDDRTAAVMAAIQQGLLSNQRDPRSPGGAP